MGKQAKEEKKNRSGPLAGIRIVECATWHAGPGGSAILGDLGAEVIKVETLHGDPERQYNRLGAVRFDIPHAPDWNFLFELSNRNKRGICLDIKTEKGAWILHQLVKTADVFVTNMRTSTKPRLGLDYESLSKINPRLIHASMTGFGPKGPMADVGGFDPMGQAVSGMLFLADDNEPVYLQAVVLDQMASVAFSHAILAALVSRERLGIGQSVDVSLYGSAIMLTYANAMATSMMGKNVVSRWDRFKNSPMRNNFKCRDGLWIMGTNHPEQKYWSAFCKAIGIQHLEHDPRYAETDARNENAAELVALCDEVFLQKNRHEWMQIFIETGLLFAPVQKLTDVVNDPQARANNYIVPFDHPELGNTLVPGHAASFSKQFAGMRKPAPKLGQHTDEVMKEIGLSEEEIKGLKGKRVIR